jgi:hypothetical protein
MSDVNFTSSDCIAGWSLTCFTFIPSDLDPFEVTVAKSILRYGLDCFSAFDNAITTQATRYPPVSTITRQFSRISVVSSVA